MASLRKHPKSPFWIACYRDSNGTRTTRSTKTRNRSDALKMAVEWESAAKKAASGRLSEAQARAVINSIMEHSGQDPITFYKVREWFEEWLTDKKNSREKTTAAKYEQVVERFLKFLGRKADSGLGSLKTLDIRGFRDLLLAEGRAASTVNQLVAKVLSAPLSKAVRLGYIPLNPCAAVESLKTAGGEAGTFTLRQVKSLIAVAPSTDWRGLILAGFFTGQRLGDLARLTWNQVDLTNEMILIDKQEKTGVGVAIPIHPDLLDHLIKLPAQDKPEAPVFPELFAKSGSGKSGLSETFKRTMTKAGIKLQKRLEAAGPAGRGRNELSFHSLRHSFTSALANAGIPEEVRQKLTGHRDKDTHKIYTHLDFPSLKAAVATVPSIKSTLEEE